MKKLLCAIALTAGAFAQPSVPVTNLNPVTTGTVIGRNTAGTGRGEVLSTLPNAVQDNITRTGTITSGTWNGTPITNGNLANSAITIAGTSVALGASTSSFPSPGAIGGTTPGAGTFTTLVAGSPTSLLVGTAGSAVGSVGFRNATSGTSTLAPPTGALGTYQVTLPNAASTLPIFGQQVTFAGPTAARTVTFPDANFTAARTDAGNAFTGASTASAWVLTSPTITTGIAPTVDDGAALGDATHNFSDLFLASGALINYANSNVVITHSSGILTMGTGEMRITTVGTNTASVVTVGGTATLTGKSYDVTGTGNVFSYPGEIVFEVNGAGSALTTGLQAAVADVLPTGVTSGTITGWRIYGDGSSGSIVFDIWKDTNANFPPTIADTITASAKPTVSAAVIANSNTLTGWTTSIAVGDALKVNIDSISTFTYARLVLYVNWVY